MSLPPTTPRNITLEEWLATNYGESRPSIMTARRWCRNGNIWPKPEKHGRAYYVRADARYIDPANPPADLLPTGRASPLKRRGRASPLNA